MLPTGRRVVGICPAAFHVHMWVLWWLADKQHFRGVERVVAHKGQLQNKPLPFVKLLLDETMEAERRAVLLARLEAATCHRRQETQINRGHYCAVLTMIAPCLGCRRAAVASWNCSRLRSAASPLVAARTSAVRRRQSEHDEADHAAAAESQASSATDQTVVFLRQSAVRTRPRRHVFSFTSRDGTGPQQG